MKTATFTKILAAAALVAAPMALQARVASREGATVGASEHLSTGALIAALFAAAAVVGGAIALTDDDTPASA